MSIAVTQSPPLQAGGQARKWPVGLMLAGLALLVLPYYGTMLVHVLLWRNEDQGHAPIILGVTLWLAWSRRERLFALPDRPARLAGWTALALGLTGYVIGVSQSVDTLEVLSHLPLYASLLLLTKGYRGLRWGLFFLFFLLFMVPLPGLLVQAMTTPLKIAVSHVAESVLHMWGYPVARSGVILYVGPYQLMVADACAGLNSMFTLEALGLLYLNVMNHTSVRRNAALCLSVIPVAFVANVVRVIALVLVTFYFGDEAGQGFVHDFAGMVLFLVALTLMLSLDTLYGRFLKDRDEPEAGR